MAAPCPPQVYAVEIPLSTRIRLELLRSHKFFRVLAPAQSEAERRQKVLHSLHILTTETKVLFTIALFYGINVRIFRSPPSPASLQQPVLTLILLLPVLTATEPWR